MGQKGQGRDPGASGNLARRSAGHERRPGHPDRPRRHDIARRCGGARHGQMLHFRRRHGARRLPCPQHGGRRQDLQGRRLDFARRFDRRGLRRPGDDQGSGTHRRLRRPDGSGRQFQEARRARQRRHAGRCQGGPRIRCQGHRPVPYRAHVLPGRSHPRGARDDSGRRRGRTAQGAGQTVADAAQRFRGHLPRNERAAGHHPPARSAAARVRAAR